MATVELSGIRVVVFDLDDTLYAERDYVFSGYRAVAQWLAHRVRFSPDELFEQLRVLFDTSARPRVFNQLLADLNLAEYESTWVPEMIAAYRGHRPTLTLLPDAQRALQRWNERFDTALITDGEPAVQEAKLEALGLNERIGTIVLTGRWGRRFWKPHARAFEFVEQACSASGKQLVYVADNPVKDFVSPRQRGWQSLRVRRPGGIYVETEPVEGGRPDAEAVSLDEVTLNS